MEKIIVALDCDTLREAQRTVETLGDAIIWYKVGLQLYLSDGANALDYLLRAKKKVFLDLKFFDIPNTVEHAAKSAGRTGASMTTVHALGGKEMISRARKGANETNPSLALLAVTILTSVDEEALEKQMGLSLPLEEQVARLAKLATNAGANGIVCSPYEICMVREACGKNVLIVTPGVRMPDESAHDQKRVKTPMDALNDGADFVVMGRSLTEANAPLDVVKRIEDGLR